MSCETDDSQRGSERLNAEAEESTVFEVVQRQPEKTQQTEKAYLVRAEGVN